MRSVDVRVLYKEANGVGSGQEVNYSGCDIDDHADTGV